MYHTLSVWDAYNNWQNWHHRIVQRLFAGCLVIFDDEKSYQLFNFNGKKKTYHSQINRFGMMPGIFNDGTDFAVFGFLKRHKNLGGGTMKLMMKLTRGGHEPGKALARS